MSAIPKNVNLHRKRTYVDRCIFITREMRLHMYMSTRVSSFVSVYVSDGAGEKKAKLPEKNPRLS